MWPSGSIWISVTNKHRVQISTFALDQRSAVYMYTSAHVRNLCCCVARDIFLLELFIWKAVKNTTVENARKIEESRSNIADLVGAVKDMQKAQQVRIIQ